MTLTLSNANEPQSITVTQQDSVQAISVEQVDSTQEIPVSPDVKFLKGEKGDKGDQGEVGPQGEQGPKGDSYVLTEADKAEIAAMTPTPDVSGQIGEHNVSTAAHSDIRILVEELTARLTALADSDDETLDQLSEVVAYIKDNRELIESVTTAKVSVADIVDNLTTNVSDRPLSAAQGVALKALIDAITVPTKVSELENDAGYLTDAVLADQLIECGETNGWTWRKWESGVYECWGVFEDTCTHYTVSGTFYGFYSTNFSYPITFVEPPIVLFNCKIGNGFGMPAGDVMRSTSACRCYAMSTAKDTVTCYWEINVKGRWK